MLFLERQNPDIFSWQHPCDDNLTCSCMWERCPLINYAQDHLPLGWESLSGLRGRQLGFAPGWLAMLDFLAENIGWSGGAEEGRMR